MSQQETISKVIKRNYWNILSLTEQAILERMGFSPGTPPKPKAPPTPRQQKSYPTLKEYYIIAHIKCKLCGHRTHECYHMKRVNYTGNGQPHLRAFKCTEEEALQNKAKREVHSRPHCIVCKERLMEKTKEELVELTVAFSKKAACIWR